MDGNRRPAPANRGLVDGGCCCCCRDSHDSAEGSSIFFFVAPFFATGNKLYRVDNERMTKRLGGWVVVVVGFAGCCRRQQEGVSLCAGWICEPKKGDFASKKSIAVRRGCKRSNRNVPTGDATTELGWRARWTVVRQRPVRALFGCLVVWGGNEDGRLEATGR